MKLEKAVGEPCVEQERCSQPPRPWISKAHVRGGFKNTNGGFFPSGCGTLPGRCQLTVLPVQEKTAGTLHESLLCGNELILPNRLRVNYVVFNAFK